mgnify:CR=1 FL=1
MKNKTKLLLLFICFITFSSCNDDKLSETVNIESTTRAMNTSDYYWGSTGKIPITQSSSKSYVLFKAEFEKKNNSTNIASISDLQDYNLIKSTNRNTAYISDNLKVGVGKINEITTLVKLDEIVYAAPYYVFDDGKEFPLTNIFYVEVKSSEGIVYLEELAEKNNVDIVGKIPLTEDAYILSCTKSSAGNALEMANLFYETGLFLSSTPEFLSIEFNCVNDLYFQQQWNLKNTGQYGGRSGIDINLCNARAISTGSSDITIAVIDQGIPVNHPDLNVSYTHDAVSQNNTSVIYGAHGVACAGIIGAKSNNGAGIAGIAPDCKLMSIGTNLSTASLVYAFRYAAENGADVISNSWGGYVNQPTLNSAIKYALQSGRNGKGCVVVFSAGNDNSSVPYYPQCSDKDIIVVGAIALNGERKTPTSSDTETTWGSNYGTALDVMAPGVLIPTTDLLGGSGYNPNQRIHPRNGGNKIPTDFSDQDYTVWFNGTSAACPHVAGIAGLILSVYPDLTQKEVSNIIEKSAKKVREDLYNYQIISGRSNGKWHNEMGYGLVDAYRALIDPLEISGPSEVRTNKIVTYNLQNLPTGISVTGYSISPSGYKITSGAMNRTSIDITFTAGGQYKFEITFTMPNGLTHTISKSITVVSTIPEITGSLYMDFATFRVINRALGANIIYQWEVNGHLYTWSNPQIYVNRAGNVYTDAVFPPPGYYPAQIVYARCKSTYDGITGWSEMAAVSMPGDTFARGNVSTNELEEIKDIEKEFE